MLKIGLVVDLPNWALGRIASSLSSELAAPDLEFRIFSDADLTPRHPRAARELCECDVVHWLSTAAWYRLGGAYLAARSAVSVHHVADGEQWKCEIPGAARIVSASHVAARAAEQRCGRTIDQVIPYGFDSGRYSFCPPDEVRAARASLGIPTAARVVGMSGNAASTRKGVDLLVDTLQRVPPDERPHLVVTGKGWSSWAPALEPHTAGLTSLEVSSPADLRRCYAALDVYLCLSTVEGGPLPVLEAMACGVPTVSTAVGHVPEIVALGEHNGRLVEGDPDEVWRAVDELCSTGGRTRPAIAESVLTRSWTAVSPDYLSLYRDVAEEARLHRRSMLGASVRLESRVYRQFVRSRLKTTRAALSPRRR